MQGVHAALFMLLVCTAATVNEINLLHQRCNFAPNFEWALVSNLFRGRMLAAQLLDGVVLEPKSQTSK